MEDRRGGGCDAEDGAAVDGSSGGAGAGEAGGRGVLRSRGGDWLVVVAAGLELRAIGRGLGVEVDEAGPAVDWRAREVVPGVWCVLSGVGKANAAGATVAGLLSAEAGRFAGVVSLGIGGSMDDGVGVGDVVVGRESVFADEGAERDVEGDGWSGEFPAEVAAAGGAVVDGVDWESTAAFGFAMGQGLESEGVVTADGMGVLCDAGLVDAVSAGLGGERCHCGRIATVSLCAGTDGRRAVTLERAGGRGVVLAEAMEGAAVGLAAARVGAMRGEALPFVEVRVMSNRTGSDAGWDVAGAMERLSGVAAGLFG